MPGFCATEIDCLGTLTISGQSMNRAAWIVPNVSPLWFNATVRGQSTLMPTAAGRRSNPTRVDEHVQDLLLVVRGDVNFAGTPTAEPWEGLAANLDFLWDNVLKPIDVGRGTRAASLLMPNGSTTKTATVRTEPLQAVGDEITDPLWAEFTLTLTITSGRFTTP